MCDPKAEAACKRLWIDSAPFRCFDSSRPVRSAGSQPPAQGPPGKCVWTTSMYVPCSCQSKLALCQLPSQVRRLDRTCLLTLVLWSRLGSNPSVTFIDDRRQSSKATGFRPLATPFGTTNIQQAISLAFGSSGPFLLCLRFAHPRQPAVPVNERVLFSRSFHL